MGPSNLLLAMRLNLQERRIGTAWMTLWHIFSSARLEAATDGDLPENRGGTSIELESCLIGMKCHFAAGGTQMWPFPKTKHRYRPAGCGVVCRATCMKLIDNQKEHMTIRRSSSLAPVKEGLERSNDGSKMYVHNIVHDFQPGRLNRPVFDKGRPARCFFCPRPMRSEVEPEDG